MNLFFILLSKFLTLIESRLSIIYNRFFFFLAGIQYGKHLKVFGHIYLKGRGRVIIGDDFVYNSGRCYNPINRNIKGAFYTISRQSQIIIGNNVGISGSCLWAQKKIQIGNNVNIGGDCLIIDNDAHPHDYLKRRVGYLEKVGWESFLNEVPAAPIVIEDDVWVGSRCQVLKGVHIGARSIIAAGSIVTKDIPSDVLAGGIPCRVIKSLL